MGALNTAVRGIARAFQPSQTVALNQAAETNENTQTVEWDDGMVGAFPDLGKDYVGTQLSIFHGVLTVPAAVRCCQVLTDITARLPKHAVTKSKFPEKVEDHWVNFLFENPNPTMSKYQFERYIYGNVNAQGEQFIIVERQPDGVVSHLTPAKFQGYKFSGNDHNPYLQLQVPDMFMYNNGLTSTRINNREVLLSDVIHLTDNTYDPFRGRAIRPMMQKGRNPIGLYLAVLKRYEASLFLGGHARNYLQTSVEQWKTFSNMIKESGFRGLMSASKTVPLPFGSVITEAGRSHIESQTLEMLMFLIGDIARAWGVPLFMLYSDVQSGSSGKASRPDLAEQFINFVRSGFGTQAESYESEFNRKLFGVNSSLKVRIKFDLDSLTAGTMQQRAELAKNMVGSGIWTVNEGREFTDKRPKEGGDVLRSPTGAPGDNKPIGDGNTNKNDDDNEDENDDNVDNNVENLFQHSRFFPELTINQL